jgi:hypothetical protein
MVGGFKSVGWAASRRYGGRHQIGTVGVIASVPSGCGEGTAGLYWAVDVASVPVAARGGIGALPSFDDCSAPCGSGLSFAAGGVLVGDEKVVVAEEVDGHVVAAGAASGGERDLMRPIAIDRVLAELASAVDHGRRHDRFVSPPALTLLARRGEAALAG